MIFYCVDLGHSCSKIEYLQLNLAHLNHFVFQRSDIK